VPFALSRSKGELACAVRAYSNWRSMNTALPDRIAFQHRIRS